jgi:aspartokinase
MLSADPRLLDNPSDAKLIEEIDYITAKEIT